MENEIIWLESWEATIFIINSIVAVILNSLIVFLVYRNKNLRTSFNATIINASVADITVSINIIASTIDTITKNGQAAITSSWCKFTGFVNLLSFVGSVMSLAAVSVNRYCLVCQNQIYWNIFTKFGTAVYIVSVWMISALLSTPPFYGWGRFAYHDGKSVCFADWRASTAYMLFMILICFCGPISATLLSLFFILRIKRRTAAMIQNEMGDFEITDAAKKIAENKRQRKEKNERRITISIAIVALVFFIAWGPFVVVMFLDVFGTKKVPRSIDIGAFMFGCFNSSANPIIYMLVNTNFKKELRKVLNIRCNAVADIAEGQIGSYATTEIPKS